MPPLDPRLLQTIAQHQDQATQTGEDFQSLPLRGFASVMRGVENLPKALGAPYSTSEALESLPPPGAMGPAAPAGAALGGFGKLLIGLGRIGVLPGRAARASAINKQGLRGPWFHGTKFATDILPLEQGGPQTIEYLRSVLSDPNRVKGWNQDTINRMWRDLHSLEAGKSIPPTGGGFSLDKVGTETGTRLGEPAGVSVTRDPAVARNFGDILRVGVNVPPSSVGEFVDPEFQRVFKEAYSRAMNLPPKLALREGMTAGYGREKWAAFNQAMTDYLRSKGVEAIRYNPKRWQEFELRVLDPEKAVPLGMVYPDPKRVMTRYVIGTPTPLVGYTGGFDTLREKLLQQAPDFPIRLHDILKEVQD